MYVLHCSTASVLVSSLYTLLALNKLYNTNAIRGNKCIGSYISISTTHVSSNKWAPLCHPYSSSRHTAHNNLHFAFNSRLMSTLLRELCQPHSSPPRPTPISRTLTRRRWSLENKQSAAEEEDMVLNRLQYIIWSTTPNTVFSMLAIWWAAVNLQQMYRS